MVKRLPKAQKVELFSEKLRPFLPENTEKYVAMFLVNKVVHFTISKDRKTKHGDYRQPYDGKPHRISVNGSLNPYAFLITTIHELAHLTTFEKFGNKVRPHGPEWKDEYRKLFAPILREEMLPEDVQMALLNYMKNVKASSCSDDRLSRVLRRYDKDPGLTVEQLELGEKFRLDGQVFVKGKKLRRRYECAAWPSGKKYRILGVAEIDKEE